MKALAWLLLLALPAWSGDPEVARFLYEKGQKAFRAKEYEQAEKYYQRALTEHTPYPEASYAHGQALEKLGRGAEAAHAYRVCIAAVEGADKPSSKWKTASKRSARALKKLRKQYAQLDSLNTKFLKRFLDLGKRHYKTNPRWARRAFEIVLAIDPTNSSAKAYLEALPKKGESTGGSEKKGKEFGKPLIKPDSLSKWDPGESANWSIRGGVITGDAVGRSGHINWHEGSSLHGDYAVQLRFRVIRDGGARRTVGLFIGDGKDAWWAIMLDDDDSMVLVRMEGDSNNGVKSRAVGKAKWSEWHTLRVEVKDEVAKIHFDDKLLIEHEPERNRRFAGMLGLFIQNAKVEFKELELRK